MFVRLMHFLVLFLYAALVGVLLVHFDAGALLVMLCLTVIPMVVLWRTEKLEIRYVVPVLLLVFGLTVVIEVGAYINGLWYEITPWDIRMFGLVPLETFIATGAHVLFLLVTYEYFFDDRKTSKHPRIHYPVLMAIVASLLALAVGYVYLFSGFFLSYPFVVLVLFGSLLFAGGLLFARNRSGRVFLKAALFAAVMAPYALVYELVAVVNELRFFANTNEYIATLSVLGQSIPIEEIIFVVLTPFWLAVMYELYLDDGQ